MLSTYVERMFPISFARKDVYGARSLSESNLVSWLQNFAPDSSIPHTFVISENIPETFGFPIPENEVSNMSIEFIIGGYYVKLSDRYFTNAIETFVSEGEKTTSYYVSIKFRDNGEGECFRTLDGAESEKDGNVYFDAITIHKVEAGDPIPKDGAYILHLFDLKQKNTGSGDTLVKEVKYIIPRTSLRTIDGGEI